MTADCEIGRDNEEGSAAIVVYFPLPVILALSGGGISLGLNIELRSVPTTAGLLTRVAEFDRRIHPKKAALQLQQ